MAGELDPQPGAPGDVPVGAVVLAGGGGARLGGADKASIEVGGRTLLDHALAALADVDEVVVVGPEVPTSRPVTFTREDPAGGGPAAGLLAGVRRFARTPTWVVVLAVDMPLVSQDTVRRLIDAVRDDGAVLVDPSGRRQSLCAAYSLSALEAAADDRAGHGLSMRELVTGLRLAEVASTAEETRDLDTWEDLVALREALGPGGEGRAKDPDSRTDG
ncbi:molybdenum cofactor guanylyltransferase [Nocardioides pocheonensis]|uniref:molybdenum cofactor guanylyltransferase n=1 Tax=Nocardioides pocheonensis TaxID=661485 RepID=UPI001FE378E7|nr:NTP transferase domain-containing protein [Nocardioides pocheonensis]